ncbi:MAG TPA: FGGY family carbohydrate kinase, partial [Streptosporangiaceae bacterium]|nr:FGGY family carbohydrate kinase [Streptosporangiaceae bacterium]
MTQPSDSVLVAIDVGTSGARASAFTTDGTELAQVRRSYPTALPGEGRAEQDALRWQTAALSALTSLVRDVNAPITAIGLTGQCPSVVPLDRSGRPLRPGIIYRDNRATAEAAQIRARFGDQHLHALTGHLPAAFHVAAKILWIRAREPGVYKATRLFAQPSDYVGLALTGEPGTDRSVAAATALLDLRHRTWAAELITGLDLDPQTLPPIRPSWSVLGTLRPALARRLQLNPGT